MLNEDILIIQKEAVEFTPLPKDIYQVELLDISSKTQITYDTRTKPIAEQEMENVFSFQFVLLEGKDGEKSLRGRNCWANFVPTYLYISSKRGKNMLYRIVEGLLGRELTRQEVAEGLTGKKLNELIGKQCRVSIEPIFKGDKIFDKITDIYRVNNQLQPLTTEEREKSKVKTKENIEIENALVSEEEINIENIPF